MPRADQTEFRVRIVIEHPVPGVRHSLQTGDTGVLDPKESTAGEPLTFDFPIRVAPGPKFFGDQVRREGSLRRFVYIRVGQAAGDHASAWSRRMKIDVHDTPQHLLDRAMAGEGALVLTVDGRGRDGTPACATVKVVGRGMHPPARDPGLDPGSHFFTLAPMAYRGGWVYIMADRYRGTMYVGVTSDLPSRIHQHRCGDGSDFCQRYGLHRLVWAEHMPSMIDAITQENASSAGVVNGSSS